MKAGKITGSSYRLTYFQQCIELSRPWLLLGAYIVFAYYEIWWLAVPAAIATCLAGFVQMHDSIHSSLGFSKKANDIVLTLSALLLLKSGHGLMVTHLRHHGQCLTDNDPEGEPARWKLRQVFINGPWHIFALRFASLKMAPGTKGIQLLETALTVVILAGFVTHFVLTGSLASLVFWGVAIVMSSLMPLWASYIPHHVTSRNKTRLAAVKVAAAFTPVVSSFAFHHLHHTYPKVPTALLPKAAKELPEPEKDEHHH